jgi:hypothetical protein
VAARVTTPACTAVWRPFVLIQAGVWRRRACEQAREAEQRARKARLLPGGGRLPRPPREADEDDGSTLDASRRTALRVAFDAASRPSSGADDLEQLAGALRTLGGPELLSSVRNRRGVGLLHVAATSGNHAAAACLLEARAAVEAVDRRGAPPLLLAARAGHGAVLEVLLRTGVPLGGDGGGAPLAAAIERRDAVSVPLAPRGGGPRQRSPHAVVVAAAAAACASCPLVLVLVCRAAADDRLCRAVLVAAGAAAASAAAAAAAAGGAAGGGRGGRARLARLPRAAARAGAPSGQQRQG